MLSVSRSPVTDTCASKSTLDERLAPGKTRSSFDRKDKMVDLRFSEHSTFSSSRTNEFQVAAALLTNETSLLLSAATKSGSIWSKSFFWSRSFAVSSVQIRSQSRRSCSGQRQARLGEDTIDLPNEEWVHSQAVEGGYPHPESTGTGRTAFSTLF